MASLKRKSHAAEFPSVKASTKRQRTDTQRAHSESPDHKRADKQSKPGKDSSKSTRSAPISLLTNEQPAFPRGGASLLTAIEKKQIQAQASRDALKEHASSGDLFSTSHEVLDDSDSDDITRDTPRSRKKRRKKASKQKPSDGGLQEIAVLRVEGLSYKVSLLRLACVLYLTLQKRIVPGSLILGQITRIDSRDITVALPNNLTGYVPMTAVSSQLTAKIENLLNEDNSAADDENLSDGEDETDLTHYFRVGQYVRAAVTSTEESLSKTSTRAKKHIELSLDPKLSNSGLSRSDVVVGCTVQVSVISIEDHGLIVDLGFDGQTTGFISTQELGPAAKLSSIKTGTVMLCLVTGLTSNGRTIKLSANEEKLGSTVKSHILSTAPTIDSFLPGTAVEVLLSDVTDSGLAGKIIGMLDATADLVHSGAAAGADGLERRYKPGTKVKGRLICNFPASETKKVGFSVLDNVLGLQSLDTTLAIADNKISISSVIPDVKVVRVESGLGVYLELGAGLPKGFVHMSRLSDSKVDSISPNIGPFKLDSTHTGRVLDFNPVDNLFIMSLQERVVNQPYLRVEDVQIGEVVKGKIERLLISETGVTGLIVEISEGVTGLVPELHFSDIILEHPEKKFREGQNVKARVVSIDTGKRQIRLTLKKTLVNSEQPIWKDFTQIAIGDVCPGTLVKVDARGAVVQFYGSVKGFLPVSEMSEAYIQDAREHFRRGQVVTVNAISVDAEAERLTVSCRDPSASNLAFESEIAALVPGALASGTVFEKSQDDILLRLDQSNVVARLRVDHASDGSLRKRRSALQKIRVGQHLQNLLILEVQTKRKLVTLCNRASLVKASRDGSLLKKFEDLREGKTVTGFISNITADGAFVNFAAGLCGLIPKGQVPVVTEDEPDFGLTHLQPVTARITSIDYRGPLPRFWLTMKEGNISSSEHSKGRNAVSATENVIVDAVDGVSQVLEDFSVGKITKVRVVSVKETQINVELARGLQGRIDVSEIFDSWENVKDRKRPLRIFSANQILPVRILGAHDTRNHKFLPITHRAGKTIVYELSAKPSIVREASYEILTMDKLKPQSSWLAFVNNIAADHLWVNISPTVRGRIRAIDVSDDLSLASNLEENFPLGSALRVRVITVDVENNRLDLTARSSGSAAQLTMKDISNGMILPGRVTKTTDRQILVQLSDAIIGRVDLIDMADDYAEANPAKYEKNDIVRVSVVRVDAPNKKIYLSMRPSKVLSSSLSVKDPEITSVHQLSVNDIRRGFISNVDDKGIFVTLGHNVTAYVRVTNLSDSYLKEWKDEFQRDQLVEGKIISVDKETGHVQMSLKASALNADYVAPLALTDLKVGDVVTGKVAQVKDFGIFIVVDNSMNIRGLCHRSEIAEQRIEDATKLFSEGDAVKAKVLKVDIAERKVNFGLKASYFAENGDDDSQDDEDSEDDEDFEEFRGGALLDTDSERDDKGNDSDDDGSKDSDAGDEVLANDVPSESLFERGTSVSDTSDETDGIRPNQRDVAATGALSVGAFDWAGAVANGVSKHVLTASDTEDEKKVSRPKKRRRAEIQVDRTGDLDRHGLQSVDDFERHLLGEPDSSGLWIRYMQFHSELGEFDQARQIGERAIKTIGLGQDAEKMNIWEVLLSLESVHGTDEGVEETLKRACEYNDPQEVYTRLTSMYIRSEKLDKAEELFQTILKRFGQDQKVWINYATFLFDKAADAEKARQLLPRALQTLPQFTHVQVTSKFAQLEFQSPSGNAERGRTIFEGLLDSFPRKMDLWNVYLDMEQSLVKQGLEDNERVRGLYGRIFAGRIKNKQAQVLFKKWLNFEEDHGDEQSVDRVKAKAADFVRRRQDEQEG
jgi:rRNA biogenesis protein RRP5